LSIVGILGFETIDCTTLPCNMLAQYLYALLGLIALAEAAVVVVSPYAPVPATCPKTPLVRPAKGLSSSEAAYRARRKKIADAALKQWLSSLKAGFDVGGSMPTVSTVANFEVGGALG
jgi:hypothetical protein